MGVEILMPDEQNHWEALTTRKWRVNMCWNLGDSRNEKKPEADVRRKLELELLA